jgi:hypothetical protein
MSLICSGGETAAPDGRRTEMSEYVQVWKARVAEDSVDRLLEVRPAAIAEAQRLCPALVGADLVRLEDGMWLDVLRWSVPDGEERLMAHAARFDAVSKMHALLEDAEQLGRGEVVAPAG